MRLGFLYLKNDGSPTQWIGDSYIEYVSKIEASLPTDLRSMVQRERFGFDQEKSFWHAELHSFSGVRGELELRYLSDDEARVIIFKYSGVRKFGSNFESLRAMPSMIVQELTVNARGLYRHAISHLGGEFIVIYAEDMNFWEVGNGSKGGGGN